MRSLSRFLSLFVLPARPFLCFGFLTWNSQVPERCHDAANESGTVERVSLASLLQSYGQGFVYDTAMALNINETGWFPGAPQRGGGITEEECILECVLMNRETLTKNGRGEHLLVLACCMLALYYRTHLNMTKWQTEASPVGSSYPLVLILMPLYNVHRTLFIVRLGIAKFW